MADKTRGAKNSALYGLSRNERNYGNYQNHSLIRNDWRSQDILRDAYGYVPVIISSSTGLKSLDRARSQSGVRGPFFYDQEMQKNLNNAGVTRRYPNSSGHLPIATSNTGKFSLLEQGGTDQVYFARNSWNNAKVRPGATTAAGQSIEGNVRSLLLKENEGSDIQGVPYFAKYFHQDPATDPLGMQPTEARMAGSTEPVPPLMNRALEVENIYDHFLEYRVYDPDDDQGDYNIAIHANYNFYLDSDPDYETAIASIPESMIPNYYMLEICFATGSDDSPPIYKEALSLAGNLDQIDRIINKEGTLEALNDDGVLTEQQIQQMSQGYFQYFLSNLETYAPASVGAYNTSYTNIAVLSEDIANDVLQEYNEIARDDRGTVAEGDDALAITSYPFYNHLEIPYTNQFDQTPIYDTLVAASNEDDASKFFTVMQLAIIDVYNETNDMAKQSLGFNLYDVDTHSLEGQNTSVDLYLNLEEMMSQLVEFPAGSLRKRLETLARYYNTAATPAPANSNSNTIFINSAQVLGAAIGDHDIQHFVGNTLLASSFEYSLLDVIETYHRRYVDLFAAGPAYAPAASEPIMYAVEKRVVPPGADAADPASEPVQTLFFGKDLKNQRGINYFDTQVKYGVKYQYDIKQIRLVIGNRYHYTSAMSIVNDGPVHEGRALGNALGFFAPEDPSVTATTTYQRRILNWDYVPEGGTTSFDRDEQRGYFIYKFQMGNNVKRMFTEIPASPPLEDYTNAVDTDWFEITGGRTEAQKREIFASIQLKPKLGTGFDGNPSGGFVGGTMAIAQEGGPLAPVDIGQGAFSEEEEEEETTTPYVDPRYGTVTSGRVNEGGFFTGTSYDVLSETSLTVLITRVANEARTGTHNFNPFAGSSYAEWKPQVIAILREGMTVGMGPDTAMAAQLWLLSETNESLRAGRLLNLAIQIDAARNNSQLELWSDFSQTNFPCNLEQYLYGNVYFRNFAASLGVIFDSTACSGAPGT